MDSVTMNNKPVNHSKDIVSCCSTWNLQKDETNIRDKLTLTGIKANKDVIDFIFSLTTSTL